MKPLLILPLLFFFILATFWSCTPYMYTGYVNDPKTPADIEKNKEVERKWSNIAPLYSYKNASPKLRMADDEFVRNTLNTCKCDSAHASIFFIQRGFQYFRADNSEIASKRFNQAYLLDSSNYKIYWGFADIMAKQIRNDEAVKLFKMAFIHYKKTNPGDSNFVWLCFDATNPYIHLYLDTKNKTYIDSAFALLDNATTMLPNYAMISCNYSKLFLYLEKYPQALEYYNKAIALDKSLTNEEYLESIKKKMGQ